jgi:hypothetical protein
LPVEATSLLVLPSIFSAVDGFLPGAATRLKSTLRRPAASFGDAALHLLENALTPGRPAVTIPKAAQCLDLPVDRAERSPNRRLTALFEKLLSLRARLGR